MRTHSVSLSSSEAAALEDAAAQHPGASLHLIHLAVLRIGVRAAREDRAALAAELLRIQDERRARRQTARAAQESSP